MRPARSAFLGWVLVTAMIAGGGCGPVRTNAEGEGHGHEESPSGASFKAGKGITFTDETRRILGVETADVTEEKLPRVVRFNIQLLTESHRFVSAEEYHADCDVHGSGFLPPEKAGSLAPRQPAKLTTASDETLDGFVIAVQKTLAHGENEIIIGIVSAGVQLKDGEFLKAAVALPSERAVTVIPRSALLKTAQGTFVYAVNGPAYYRTAVRVGSEADDKVEIVDGLYAGDQVVTNPVETLWLIELRATKGGGHSH